MKRILPLLLLLSCADETTLGRVCPETCYELEPFPDAATCKQGTPICDEKMNVIDCVGAVYPEDNDLCDGLDNDCDGIVDNGRRYPTRSFQFPRGEEPCPTTGVCRNAFVQCVNGRFQCNLPGTYEPIETRCDGNDNDCNGQVDDIIPICTDLLGNPTSCSCFDGPPGAERNPPCQSGYYECNGGLWQCVGQRTPLPETCNGIDDDCNGILDDTGSLLNTKYDIVFNLDTSGSMCEELFAISQALITYLGQFSGNPNFRFAIVNLSNNNFPLVSIYTPFSDIAVVQQDLQQMNCNGSGSEAGIRSIEQICLADDPLGLGWRPDAKRLIFMFTDEPPQLWDPPPITLEEAIQVCIVAGIEIYAWAPVPYDPVILAGGQRFSLPIYPTSQDILDDLNSILVELCQ